MDDHGSKPRARSKAADDKTGTQAPKRSRIFCQTRKVIGPNDIFVNMSTGKIKLEGEVTIKSEVTDEPGLDSLPAEPSSNDVGQEAIKMEVEEEQDNLAEVFEQVVSIVKEEINLPIDSENADDGRIFEQENVASISVLCSRSIQNELNTPHFIEEVSVELDEPMPREESSHRKDLQTCEKDSESSIPDQESSPVSIKELNKKQSNSLECLELNMVLAIPSDQLGHSPVQLAKEDDETSTIRLTDNKSFGVVNEEKDLLADRDEPEISGDATVRGACGHPSNECPKCAEKYLIIQQLRERVKELENILPGRKNVQEAYVQTDDREETLFPLVLPLLFKNMSKNDVLTCRSVCKCWKKSVDKFINDHPSRQPYDSQTISLVESRWRYCTLKEKHMESVIVRGPHGFQEKLELAQKEHQVGSCLIPAFVGNSLQFDFDKGFVLQKPEEISRYYEHLEGFLTEFGLRILYAHIPFILNLIPVHEQLDVKQWEKFRGCIKKLSNLKSLTLDRNGFGDFGIDGSFKTPEDVQTIRKLKQTVPGVLLMFPIPDLPYLETLELLDKRIFPDGRYLFHLEYMCNEFLHKFSPQIRKLSMNLRAWDWNAENSRPLMFPVLTELNVLFSHFWNSQTFMSLLKNFNAPRLEKLAIAINSHKVSFMQLFKVVNSRNLKVLEIRADVSHPILGRCLGYPNVTGNLPTVPTLTRFILHHFPKEGQELTSLHFLKFMPMLEYLEIHITVQVGEEELTSHKPQEYFTNITILFKETLVMGLLPKLRMCIIRNDVRKITYGF